MVFIHVRAVRFRYGLPTPSFREIWSFFLFSFFFYRKVCKFFFIVVFSGSLLSSQSFVNKTLWALGASFVASCGKLLSINPGELSVNPLRALRLNLTQSAPRFIFLLCLQDLY
jgi:hypothetical protein